MDTHVAGSLFIELSQAPAALCESRYAGLGRSPPEAAECDSTDIRDRKSVHSSGKRLNLPRSKRAGERREAMARGRHFDNSTHRREFDANQRSFASSSDVDSYADDADIVDIATLRVFSRDEN